METLKHQKVTKAIKDHRCNFCSLRIPKGDTYLKSTHKHDGDVYDWKAHDHCAEIATRLKMYEDAYDGVTMDDFMEFIHCEYDDLVMGIIEDKDVKKYTVIIQQLKRVNFKDKLGYVIRHYKKVDNPLNK